MAGYPREVLYTDSGDTIHLKFIESFTFERDSESLVIDKLKDDFQFGIRSVSGKDYTISAKYISSRLEDTSVTPREMTIMIYEKWIWINKT